MINPTTTTRTAATIKIRHLTRPDTTPHRGVFIFAAGFQPGFIWLTILARDRDRDRVVVVVVVVALAVALGSWLGTWGSGIPVWESAIEQESARPKVDRAPLVTRRANQKRMLQGRAYRKKPFQYAWCWPPHGAP